eukprot:TRINITY_DN382_c0_g1_i1.p1 TRINITY_DN382_c0_g1~~TRINITY_DN382_c0_g1_i1.p1  ORF type:complete len:608 (+),score=131.07 TRINITY_DN382_c0_g1_i1:77-1825(+)
MATGAGAWGGGQKQGGGGHRQHYSGQGHGHSGGGTQGYGAAGTPNYGYPSPANPGAGYGLGAPAQGQGNPYGVFGGPGAGPAGPGGVFGQQQQYPPVPTQATEDSPWCISATTQLNPADSQTLPRFTVTEAASSSVNTAIAMLNKLGLAWPHNYAVVHSAGSNTTFLLARKDAELSLRKAQAEHETFETKVLAQKRAKAGSKHDKSSRQKFPLEQRLMSHIVGQRGPLYSVAAAIRRKENGWHDTEHPLVFLFLGSSGIGKTELAKQVASYMHGGDREGFIRLDMSEYQHQHEVSKFIGAPPGYLGHDEGGQLTKRLKKVPDAVVLLDEVDKAHPDILTCLLATFDEGRLTDGKGETVDCMDAIFMMTSNLAQREIADEALRVRAQRKAAIAAGQSPNAGLVVDPLDPQSRPDVEPVSKEFLNKVVQPILKQHFQRDEFLGRINEILFFLPFTEEQLSDLAEKELKRWAENAKKRHEMRMTWDQEVVIHLTKAYNVRYGARSIMHEIERKVVSRLAKLHEQDAIGQGSAVHLYFDPADNSVQIRTDNRGGGGQQQQQTAVAAAAASASASASAVAPGPRPLQ